MALLLTVGKGDTVVFDNGIEIEILGGGNNIKMAVNAPRSIKIHTQFADKAKQYKNKQADDRALSKAQGLSVESQRTKTLKRVIRTNKNGNI